MTAQVEYTVRPFVPCTSCDGSGEDCPNTVAEHPGCAGHCLLGELDEASYYADPDNYQSPTFFVHDNLECFTDAVLSGEIDSPEAIVALIDKFVFAAKKES